MPSDASDVKCEGEQGRLQQGGKAQELPSILGPRRGSSVAMPHIGGAQQFGGGKFKEVAGQ